MEKQRIPSSEHPAANTTRTLSTVFCTVEHYVTVYVSLTKQTSICLSVCLSVTVLFVSKLNMELLDLARNTDGPWGL